MSHLSLTFENRVAHLVFDREGSRANLFDRATLEELASAIDTLQRAVSIQGLLIRSAKPSIFIAGADLNQLANASDSELRELIESGQRTFNRIADLPMPTVCAIHGACAGGGFELALACDWRIASDAPATRVGLPETQLGILPAWGGSTRLPQLLGLPDALPLILSGKLLNAKGARRKGLVDAAVPVENLVDHALTFLARGKREAKSHPLLHNAAAVSVIRHQARKDLHKKTRGLYPGPDAALEVACTAVGAPREHSLENERDAILRLAKRPETKQLIRLFFLQEHARKHRHTTAEPRKIGRVGVIGAGIMGSGIAYWVASRRHPVTLLDIADEALARGLKSIRKLAAQAADKHVVRRIEADRSVDRIHAATGPVPLGNCDLIIEAAVEELEIKKKIFADLARRARPDAVLATNTSALPVRELAASVPDPGRLLGLHFFNPVHRMKLVEVVRTDHTSDESLATAVAFVRSLGKLPVVVRDSPGFLVNRILLPYLVEAANLFDQGGDPEEIDAAMLDFGMPMGPLRLLDEVGLDVARHVATTLAEAFPDRMTIPDIVGKLLDSGHTGRKGGRGFYLYGKGSLSPSEKALQLRTGTRPAPAKLAERLAGLMSKEARMCLDEGIAETGDEIDLAMVLGTGYAPFRGGPLTHESTQLAGRKIRAS